MSEYDVEFESTSQEDTEKIAFEYAKRLKKGDIICLIGDLGTGKTAFTRGVARSFGIDEYITSPTFSIINEYYSKTNLYHFDIYRLQDIDEAYDIGIEDYFDSDGIVVFEWPELIIDIIPKSYFKVEISKVDYSSNIRKIKIMENVNG